MRIGLNWLQELVRVDVPVDKLVDLLDLSGTKVEAVHKPTAASIDGVVVAEVLDIVEHPNADNLTLVDVKTGGEDSQRVVCGAKNFAIGDRVPLARVGARLPEMEITERKIRGEVSKGMLCSAMELGISKDHSGILVLPPDADLGDDVVKVLGLDETVIELEITPNRPDSMSMVGIAREIGALLGHEVTLPETGVDTVAEVAATVEVDIQDSTGCPRYVARFVDGVQIGPSPGWLAARLLRAGIRPISNVVDVTNYVMLELGQPLHAFDAARIDGKIIVRRAKEGERFTTLDGVERKMSSSDLMITDKKKLLAIAGVMGGEDSEISASTAAVIIEAAHFDPTSVALTARRQLIRTESSARFERGMDPEAPPVAAARAARLMAELAGGRVSTDVVDVYPVPIERKRITMRPGRVTIVLGKEVATDRQAELLRSIDLGVETRDGLLEVEVPGFRPDLSIEADLVEEVARLIGFEQLPPTLPPGRIGALETEQVLERAVRRYLVSIGIQEAWTTSFLSAGDLDALGFAASDEIRTAVHISNPMSEDENLLRTTLLPGLLRSAARNLAHRAEGVALFELSRIYEPTGAELPREPLILGAVFSGLRRPQSWRGPSVSWDFFGARGVLDSLFDAFGLPGPELAPATGMPFHPTRAARISVGGAVVGAMGELHPKVCERYDVAEGTVTLELSFAAMAGLLGPKIQTEDLPRFPAIYIDLALVVDEGVSAAALTRAIEAAGAPELTSVRLFDLYRGDQVASGKKSLAYALELRDPDKTLTDADATAVRDRIVAAIGERFGAEIRA